MVILVILWFKYEGQLSESFVQVYSLRADKLKNQQPGEKVDSQEIIVKDKVSVWWYGERDLFELRFAVATLCFLSGSQCIFMKSDGCNFCKKDVLSYDRSATSVANNQESCMKKAPYQLKSIQ